MEMSLKTLLISCAASVAIFRHEDNAVNYSPLSAIYRWGLSSILRRSIARRFEIGLEHSLPFLRLSRLADSFEHLAMSIIGNVARVKRIISSGESMLIFGQAKFIAESRVHFPVKFTESIARYRGLNEINEARSLRTDRERRREE